MKASVFIATSMDGFIARSNGDIDFLEAPEYMIQDEDFGYSKFIETVDVLVMGRNSYEKVLSFDIEWPYTIPVVVLTSRDLKIPEKLSGKVSSMVGTPSNILEKLESNGFKHAYIDGGKTIQQFLKSGLISEIIITQIPVLIGQGIPLFGELQKDIHLETLETLSWKNSFVQNSYRVIRDGSD